MTTDTLTLIADAMNSLNIPYAFMQWNEEPPEMYFVGEFIEDESPTKEEDGMQETTFILTGFTRGKWASLIEAKEKIESNIPRIVGSSTQSVAVFYGSAQVISTGEADLKRLQINLTIKEWKGE